MELLMKANSKLAGLNEQVKRREVDSMRNGGIEVLKVLGGKFY